KPADHGRTNAGRDVVIARGNIRGQRAEGVEWGFVTALQLFVHVLFDQMHGHVARAFDHALNVMLPGDFGELSQGFQFAELGGIVGIGDGARTQAITEAEGDIVCLHDFADVFEVFVKEAFLVVRQAPLGHDGTASRNDAGGAFGSQWYMVQTYTSVNSEIIHALLCLLDQRVAKDFPGEVFRHAAHFLKCLIDGHGANRDRRVADDPLAGFVDVLAGGQVHHRVGTPADAPGQFFHFVFNGRSHGRVADVAVDLHQEVAADDHRLGFRVVDVGGNDGATSSHLITHELRGNFRGQTGPE